MSLAGAELVNAGRKLLERTMSTEEWKLAGTIEVCEEVRPGVWQVTTPADDPLRLEHVPTGRKLAVPFRMMESDFASVPEAAQKLGSYSRALHLAPRSFEKAAFFHDQLYDAHWCWAVADGKAVQVPVTRRQADAILFICLECLGATVADGLAYHGAVSLFGGPHWERSSQMATDWPKLFDEPPKALPEGGAS